MKPLTDEKRKDVSIVDGNLFDRSRSKKVESKRKDCLVLVSTDVSISEEEIIRVYGKRWDIKVFFKACKSYLRLVKEYRGISYDAMGTHVAIVFARYMMLSVAQRENQDDKTICELCFCLLDEMEDITFRSFMCIIPWKKHLQSCHLFTIMKAANYRYLEFISSFDDHSNGNGNLTKVTSLVKENERS